MLLENPVYIGMKRLQYSEIYWSVLMRVLWFVFYNDLVAAHASVPHCTVQKLLKFRSIESLVPFFFLLFSSSLAHLCSILFATYSKISINFLQAWIKFSWQQSVSKLSSQIFISCFWLFFMKWIETTFAYSFHKDWILIVMLNIISWEAERCYCNISLV